MGEHHINGSSTLSRRDACPGSYAAELPLFDTPEEDSADAAAGSLRHDAAAAGLREPDRRPELLAGLPVEDQALVESWWSYWHRVQATMAVAPGTEVLGGVEDRVELPGGRFGSCDAWLAWVHPDGHEVLVVGDLKGQPPGRARYNLQLADYARGLDMRLGHAAGRQRQIIVTLVSRSGVDEHAYGDGEHAALVARIEKVLDDCQKPDAPRTPGDGCTYCRARESCDARRAMAVRQSTLMQALADPVSYITAMEPEQRTAALDSLCQAAKALGEAEDAIRSAIKAGTVEVPGYRLIPSTRQEWADSAAARLAVLAAAQARGIDAAELTPLVSAKTATGLLGKEVVEPLTQRVPGTPSVRRMKGAA